jgi:D-tyrosyl-tRNA(Tyr) deacylase
MKAILQRVSMASVSVAGETVGEISEGLLVLLGAGRGDGPEQVEWIVRKIAQLRIFEDEAGRMNLSLEASGGSALVVSQFTLYGDCRKGNRPSFSRAMDPEEATIMVDRVVKALQDRGIPTQTGQFGANMRVELVNEGPVTLVLDTETGKG